jgi:hypothetical protein
MLAVYGGKKMAKEKPNFGDAMHKAPREGGRRSIMKAKVFEARSGKTSQDVPFEKELNQFLAGVKEIHFITQSECAVGHSSGSATRYTTVTVIYE